MKIWQRYGTNYYARFMVRGKPILWCTRTDDERTAKVRAKDYRAKLVAKEFHLADLMKSANGMPTIKQVTDEYLSIPVGGAIGCKNKNVASLKWVLSASGLKESDGIHRIDGQAAMAWQKKCLGNREEGEVCGRSRIVSCNYRLRTAKAIFSKQAMRFYEAKFKMPSTLIKDFQAVPYIPEGEGMREVPSDEAMAAAEALLKDGSHKAEYCAYLLAKYTGMRSGEIMRAEWSWIQDGVLSVGGFSGAAQTKNKQFRAIAIDGAFLAELESNKTDERYICGHAPRKTVERILPGILRKCGFSSIDPIRSLRRWHASWRYQHQSASAARNALGHSSETVTMRHYARLLTLPAPVPFVRQVQVLVP